MDTMIAKTMLEKVKTIEEFDEFRNNEEIKAITVDWEKYYNDIVDDYLKRNKKISQMDFYKYISWQCGVSVDTVRKTWRKAFPSKRISFVFLLLALDMDIEQINCALNRYGKQPQLYVKNISDAICLYLVQSNKCENDYPICERYKRIEKRILDDLEKGSFDDIISSLDKGDKSTPTDIMGVGFGKIADEDGFYNFVKSHLNEFKMAYTKLYKFIEDYMKENYFTMSMLTEYEGIHKNFNNKYSTLKKMCECPTRNELIALGIAMCMTVEELNQMLSVAHMEPMCPKDRIEAAIIFVISDIRRNFPDIFNDNSTDTGLELNEKEMLNYLNYRKRRNTEYIEFGPEDAEMMNYLKQALYNIEPELWIETKEILAITI